MLCVMCNMEALLGSKLGCLPWEGGGSKHMDIPDLILI